MNKFFIISSIIFFILIISVIIIVNNSNNRNVTVNLGNCPVDKLPPKSIISNSSGKCATSINRFSGNCIKKSNCTGGIYSGFCPGSDYCCVDETVSPNNYNNTEICSLISFSQFKSIFTSISEYRASSLYPYFLQALKYANINSCKRLAAFCAQVAHESGGLQYFEEIASGEAYEGRKDLGNTQPGDWKRFKGRGPIQLTGRSNYTKAAASLGYDIVTYPEWVSMPSIGFLTTAWFWKRNGLNTYADNGDFNGLTKKINGGYNGLADRKTRWENIKKILNCP